jgi:hypothetical protein
MATNQSSTDPDALLSSVRRIKENYQEPPPQPPKRGKKRDFSALSFLLLAADLKLATNLSGAFLTGQDLQDCAGFLLRLERTMFFH